MKSIIRVQSDFVFGNSYRIIDIYDDEDPFTRGKTEEEQDDFVNVFQDNFEALLNSNTESILSLIPYFSWTEDYWDLDFSLRSALESGGEKEIETVGSFLDRFSFRNNTLADELSERVRISEKGSSYSNDLLISYFPSPTDPILLTEGTSVLQVLSETVDRISLLNSAKAWANILPLIAEDYSDEAMIEKIIHAQEGLSTDRKIEFEKFIQDAPSYMKNPITEYWNSK